MFLHCFCNTFKNSKHWKLGWRLYNILLNCYRPHIIHYWSYEKNGEKYHSDYIFNPFLITLYFLVHCVFLTGYRSNGTSSLKCIIRVSMQLSNVVHSFKINPSIRKFGLKDVCSDLPVQEDQLMCF